MADADEQCLEESTVIQLAQGALAAPALARAESHLVHCEPCRTLLVLAVRTADRALQNGTTAALHPAPADDAPTDAGELEVPQPGTILVDKYRVEGVLGRGGMGVVLAATHLVLQSRVAIKVLRRPGPSEMARFLREARVSAQLRNRHIVRVFDFGQLPSGAPFLVMEYLEGRDLAVCIELAPLPVESVVEYVAQACDALVQVHALGIVHRDLKPANLFLTQDHGQLLIKVLDFGIFKTLAGAAFDVGENSTQLTGAQALIGSPVYMSPEQMFARDVDARSDIWALGVILYELLTRELPFGQRNLSALAVAVATTEPTPPSRLQPSIPRALEAIILRCLRKDPSERYRDAAELLSALTPLRTAAAATARHKERSQSPRRWMAMGALGAVAAGLVWWASASAVSPASPSSALRPRPEQPRQTARSTLRSPAEELPASAPPPATVEPAFDAPQAAPVLGSAQVRLLDGDTDAGRVAEDDDAARTERAPAARAHRRSGAPAKAHPKAHQSNGRPVLGPTDTPD